MYSIYKLLCCICGTPVGTLGKKTQLTESDKDVICSKRDCRKTYAERPGPPRPMVTNRLAEIEANLRSGGVPDEAVSYIMSALQVLNRKEGGS